MRLRLVKRPNGNVTLRASHRVGERPFETSLITFKTDGHVVRHPMVSPRTGLKLTNSGKVELDG